MTMAGFTACPAQAHAELRSRAHYVAQATGGRGAVREVADLILKAQGAYDALLAPHTWPEERAHFGKLLFGRHQYVYRSAPAEAREQFDAWARAEGLLTDEVTGDPKAALMASLHSHNNGPAAASCAEGN